jgi:hypothetical protein
VKRARLRQDLRVLSQPPAWAEGALSAAVGPAIGHLAKLEPKADLYVRDRMQRSLVPFYRGVLDRSGHQP